MKCPACKEPLVALELDGVEVDWCASCRGAWLDRGELELLHTNARTAQQFMSDLKPIGSLTANRPLRHPARRCPICEQWMAPVESAWDRSIVLDRCRQNDGLWFDKGELTRVLELQGGTDRVQNILSGIFSKK